MQPVKTGYAGRRQRSGRTKQEGDHFVASTWHCRVELRDSDCHVTATCFALLPGFAVLHDVTLHNPSNQYRVFPMAVEPLSDSARLSEGTMHLVENQRGSEHVRLGARPTRTGPGEHEAYAPAPEALFLESIIHTTPSSVSFSFIVRIIEDMRQPPLVQTLAHSSHPGSTRHRSSGAASPPSMNLLRLHRRRA